MSRKIKMWRDPYGEGFNTCKKREIEIEPGLTVLVGCNGAGKTTMIKNIKDEMGKANVPVFLYNNLSDGGSHSVSAALFSGDSVLGGTMICSSEGERISLNISIAASKWRKFIQTGDDGDKFKHLTKSLSEMGINEIKEQEILNERWILLDAIDSGFSVDNIIEVKELFQLVIDDARSQGIELYIIASANEYELASGENCMDVMTGKYIQFKDYDDYKKFILGTRKKKDKRYKES